MVSLDRDTALISEIYTVHYNQKCSNFDESIIHQDWMGFAHLAVSNEPSKEWVFGKWVRKYYSIKDGNGKT